MNPHTILVCAHLDSASLAILREVGDVDIRPDLTAEELPAIIGRYHAIVVDNRLTVSGRVIEEGFHLRAIGRLGSRLDNVDVSAARALGVEICNSPGSNAVARAEQTFALMLSLASRVPGWGGLAGRTLGLIGFGRIGRQVARRAQAFAMRTIVNQPRLTPELALAGGAEAVDLPDLLQSADFVSLHVPLKPETETIIGARELQLMKPGAYLLNTAHADLVDQEALLAALKNGHLAGAALAVEDGQLLEELRQHPDVVLAPPLATGPLDRQSDTVAVARQIVDILRTRRPSETLSLDIVPVDKVVPHEQTDDKRVARLMERLEEDNRLVNPPLVTEWNDHYVILDGATRFTALQRLGYPHIIVQIVDPGTPGFALHTWYHAISHQAHHTVEELLDHLGDIPGLVFTPLTTEQIANCLQRPQALCYFMSREGEATLVEVKTGTDRLVAMNELVARYTAWGTVERTLLTDLSRLLGQFPEMVAVAIFPQFAPEAVFDVATRGELLPAGLTRFVIPGRILRLNADLARLKVDEPLPAKRAWFNKFLEEKLARSRLRYYQEPVILLDE